MRAFRVSVVSVTTAALVAAGVLTAPPVVADEDDVFAEQVAAWAVGLAQEESLAAPLPVVGVAPGGLLAAADPTLGGDLSRDGSRYTLEVSDDVPAVLSLEPAFGLTTASAALTAHVTVRVEFTVGLGALDDDTSYRYVVAAGADAPAVTASVTVAGLPGAVPASVGVLGVDLTERAGADPVAFTASYGGTVADPDGDGRLTFDDPGGLPDDGELAAAGSATGLADVTLASGSTSGALAVTSAGDAFAEPVSASVDFSWPDLTDPAGLTVTPDGFDAVADFLNLTVRDTAEGLVLVKSALAAVQRAQLDEGGPTGNLDLPFLRGSVADVLVLNEQLITFLTANIDQAEEGVTDPEDGQPTWSSLQELFAALEAAPGLSVEVGAYDAEAHRLPFTLTTSRVAESVAVYTPNPALGENDLKPGLVELDDLLTDGSGRAVENVLGDSPQATSSPDYSATVELAFDLGAPVAHDPPLQVTADDGSVAFYDETPIGVDRTLFRSATATADFPIQTPVAASGLVGFVEVDVTGEIAVGRAAADAPMLTLAVAGTDYRPVGDLFTELRDDAPAALDVDLNVAASVTDGAVTVTGLPDFLPSAATWSVPPCDIAAAPAGCAPDLTGLADLLALDVDAAEPRALLGRVADTLLLADSGLRSPGLLGDAARTPLPLVGTSVADVLAGAQDGLATATALTGAVQGLVDTPPVTLQETLGDLSDSLGLPDEAPLGARYQVVDGAPSLVVDLALEREYTTTRTLAYDLDGVPLVGATSTGTVDVAASVDVSAGVAVPLAEPVAGAAGLVRLVDPSVIASVSAGLDGTFEVSLAGLTAALGAEGDEVSGQLGLTATFGATGATTLGGLLALDPTVVGTADCGSGATLLCADLPVYVLGNPISPTNGSLVVTVPDDVSLAAALAGTTVTLPDTDALAALLYSTPFDLNSLPSGILTYLGLLEQGLQAASLGGSVPLLGDQLVEAAQVVAEARAAVEGLGDLGETAYLDAKAEIESALGATITEQCGVLQATTDVEVVATTDAPSGDPLLEYSYVVVSRTGTTPTVRSAPDSAQNEAVLSTDNSNHVTWAPDGRADGYLVLRSTDGGATWQQVADVTGTEFTDDGTATPQLAPADAGEPVAITGCETNPLAIETLVVEWEFDPNGPGGDPELCEVIPLDVGIPGLALRAGTDPETGECGATDGGLQASLDYGFGVSVALDKTAGLVILTGDEGDREAHVGAAVTLLPVGGADEPDLTAQLAILQMDVEKTDPDAQEASGEFYVDLVGEPTDVGGTTLNAVRLDQLLTSPGEVIDVGAEFAVDVDWHLTAAPDVAGQTLPGISANLALAWSAGAGTAQPQFGDPTPHVGTTPTIAFTDIALDLGTFIESQVGPALEEVDRVIDPLRPVLETLYAPIPVLTDLSKMAGGDEVTLVSIAEAYNTLTGGTDTTMVRTILQVIETANTVSDLVDQLAGGSVALPVGDLTLDGSKALTTAATPDQVNTLKAPGGFDPADPTPESSEVRDSLTGTAVHDTDGFGFTFTLLEHPELLADLLLNGDVELVRFDSGTLELGFSFKQSFGPVYAPPPLLITLSGAAGVKARVIVGFDTLGLRNAVAAFQSGEPSDLLGILDGLYLATTDLEGRQVPVLEFYGELAAGLAVSIFIISVEVRGGFGLTVSFYWNDPNDDGKFRFSEFGEQAKISPICLFRTGGRLYLFLELGITIGISIFSVSFDVTIAKVTLLDFTAEPDCDPEPPVLATEAGDTLVVHLGAAGTDGFRGGSWGADADDTEVFKVYERHDFSGGTEPEGGWPVTGYAVEGLGIVQEFPGAKARVVVDGRGSQTGFQLTFLGDSDKEDPDAGRAGFRTAVVVFGSEHDDEIKTDEGAASVDARGGNDVVTAANPVGRAALLAGGPGVDRITSGQGDSVLAGDSDLPVTVTVSAGGHDFPVEVGAPGAGEDADGDDADGNDVITAGTGTNTLFGNGGADRAGVVGQQGAQRSGSPNVLVGGTGDDVLTAGPGNDVVYPGGAPSGGLLDIDGEAYTPGDGLTDAQRGFLADDAGTADAGTVNLVDTGSGSDLVVGSQIADVVRSGSLGSAGTTSYLFGGGAEDVLAGGFGSDEVFGGPADDYVLAEPTEVGGVSGPGVFGPQRTITVLALPAGETPQSDLLVGGGGRDHVVGGDGGAQAWGDAYRPAELCTAGDPVASDGDTAGADEAADVDSADYEDDRDDIVGGRGVDVVRAGGGADRARLDGAADRGCGQSGPDDLGGGDGPDQVWGGSGDDLLTGDEGADELYGNAGTDTVFGGEGTDTVEGNAGADSLFGGAAADLLVGGTRATGRDDTGDTLYGDTGTDALIGDNGAADPAAPLGYRPFDLTGPATAGGDDRLFGAAEDDLGYGGLGADLVSGQAGADHLEGGPNPAGSPDTVLGDAGGDELVGGSFVPAPDAGDVVEGGAGADVALGDNASVVPVAVDPAGTPVLAGRATEGHTVTELDTAADSPAEHGGPDVLRGGPEDDALFGQGADDPEVSGGDGDDLASGGRGTDTVLGGAGRDDLVGGSVTPLGTTVPGGPGSDGQPDAGDTVVGGTDGDVALGDNAVVTVAAGVPAEPSPLLAGRERATQAPRVLRLLDLGADAGSADSGGDLVLGEDGEDVLLGQAGDDRVQGGAADDAAEGGPGTDWLEGGDGDDDLVGGSTTPAADPGSDEPGTGTEASTGQPDAGDVILGQGGDDAALGDNGVFLRSAGAHASVLVRSSTDGTLMRQRTVVPYDLGAPMGGGDYVLGGDGVDALWGQDAGDAISGGPDDDYAEGNGAGDVVRGDEPVLTLTEGGIPDAGVPGVPVPAAAWPGTATVVPETGPDGQDDLIGGSARSGFRDGGDTIEGDGESDVALGDDGTLLRDPAESAGTWTDRVEPDRYPADTADPAYPARLFAVRLHDPARVPDGQDGTTRFCAEVDDRDTCEPAGSYGADTIAGGDGDDRLWGQDGDDVMRGGAGADDVVGELGDDELSGDAGQDTILGDRGGIVGAWIDSAAEGTFSVGLSGVPQDAYTGLPVGSFDRRVDLLSDVEDRAWVDTDAEPMPYPGLTSGGDDRIRGGDDRDVIHGGAGDDLANGDNGGDELLGGNGADVLWGGRGNPDGSPDRGVGDVYVDHVLGGASVAGSGEPSVLGADVIDWNPRGSAADPGVTCAVGDAPQDVPGSVVDPCSWFGHTSTDDADPGNDQHHHGTDWLYGGWDRDVMQGNESANGPSAHEDRLIDWNGAYNLYSHCNAGYGGWNDVRQHSPSMVSFLQSLAYGMGAGRDADDVTTPGSSAFVELALVRPSDNNQHGVGKAFPTTPGHFDDPTACPAG